MYQNSPSPSSVHFISQSHSQNYFPFQPKEIQKKRPATNIEHQALLLPQQSKLHH